jgi:alpha-ribazole phosphatase
MSEAANPTRLFLVRHGEVVPEGKGKFLGFLDVDLSPQGRKQVTKLAKYLKAIPLDRAYASDLKRAMDTALIICAGRGIESIPCPAFREMDMGDWDGKSWDEIKKTDPPVRLDFFNDLTQFYFPGGERWTQFRTRVLKGVKILLQENPGRNILLAAHAGVNRVILAQGLGLRYKNMFALDQCYACLNILEYYNQGAKVILMNGTFTTMSMKLQNDSIC